MRCTVVGIMVLALAAGCIGRGSIPPAVQPTLAAVETLGFHCDDGVKDNVPSGLFQWSCRGTLEGASSTLLVDGNDEGVAGLTLMVNGPTDPAVARSGFALLVDTVPPLSTAPVLKDTVVGWNGGQQARTVGGVRVSAQCDATHCVVTVMPSRDPLWPLSLP